MGVVRGGGVCVVGGGGGGLVHADALYSQDLNY